MPPITTPTHRSPSTRLSKSRYCYGIQCTKQLWWRVYEPDAPELTAGPALEAVFERGHRVGEIARERFPGGVLVDGEYWEVEEKVEKTRRAIASGAPGIFEAAFLEDDVFVAVDALERHGDGWILVEVKSTLGVKEPHVPDVAAQLHVLRASGLQVPRAEVMHLNRKCSFPDLTNLFLREDVTAQAEALLPAVPGEVRRLLADLAGPLPDVAPGPQCTDPYECPFLLRCNPEVPADHVSTLYRIGNRLDALLADGVTSILDIPDGLPLSSVTARQVRSVRAGRPVVEPGLSGALDRLEAPIAFLDFETIMPAVPVWDGCHPYEQIPVQMSCHVQEADGTTRHFQYLADGPNDPRAAIAEAVVSACSDAASVVACNAGFEKRCLEHLAAAVPSRRGALLHVVRRLVDLLPLVRDHVYHPGFGGSFSLKSVVPALVPDLSYADLDIGEGGSASAALEGLLLGPQELERPVRENLRRQLLDYCERDTFAMVELVRRLRSLATGSSRG